MSVLEDEPTGPGVTRERRRLKLERERPRITGAAAEGARLAPCDCGHVQGAHRARWEFNPYTRRRVRRVRCDDCAASGAHNPNHSHTVGRP